MTFKCPALAADLMVWPFQGYAGGSTCRREGCSSRHCHCKTHTWPAFAEVRETHQWKRFPASGKGKVTLPERLQDKSWQSKFALHEMTPF